MTVTNSSIHDNACKGLWADLNGDGATITNNVVANNWDEGIFIEISSGATTHRQHGDRKRPAQLQRRRLGLPVAVRRRDHAQLVGPRPHPRQPAEGNCNGITGVQQDRPDGHPGLLEDVTVDGNTVNGPGLLGVAEDNGANLTARNIVFSGNTSAGGQVFCRLAC